MLAFSGFFTAQCDSLLTDTDTIMILGTFPALQGQNITFSCFGNESWLSVCSEGGRWDPDPSETCKRMIIRILCTLHVVM